MKDDKIVTFYSVVIKKEPVNIKTEMITSKSQTKIPVTPSDKVITDPKENTKPKHNQQETFPDEKVMNFYIPQTDDSLEDQDTPTKSVNKNAKAKTNSAKRACKETVKPVEGSAKKPKTTKVKAKAKTKAKVPVQTQTKAKSKPKSPSTRTSTSTSTTNAEGLTNPPTTAATAATSEPAPEVVASKPVPPSSKTHSLPFENVKCPPKYKPTNTSILTTLDEEVQLLEELFRQVDDTKTKESLIELNKKPFSEWINHGSILLEKQYKITEQIVLSRAKFSLKLESIFKIVNKYAESLEKKDASLKENLDKFNKLGSEIKNYIDMK